MSEFEDYIKAGELDRDSDTFGSYRRSNLYRITEETYNTVHMLDGLEGVNPEGIGW